MDVELKAGDKLRFIGETNRLYTCDDVYQVKYIYTTSYGVTTDSDSVRGYFTYDELLEEFEIVEE